MLELVAVLDSGSCQICQVRSEQENDIIDSNSKDEVKYVYEIDEIPFDSTARNLVK